MIEQMAAVLQFRNKDGLWHARALDCNTWGHGETADEAMARALRGDVPVVVRRRVVVSDAPAAPRRRDLFTPD